MLSDFINGIEKTVDSLMQYGIEDVRLYHHNDADGLSSGALLADAFSRAGSSPRRYSLEKPYPLVLEKIFDTEGSVIIFADFAGKIAPLLSRMNGGRNFVIILDHHPAVDTDDPSVHNLDGDLYGLKGDRDISGSVTSFLFARTFLDALGKESGDLSHLAVLGAVGDGFLVDGALSGVNRDALAIAVERDLMRVEPGLNGETYYVGLAGREYKALHICDSLDILGGAGYYGGGPDLGIELCLQGMTDKIEENIKLFEERKNEIFQREIETLSRNLITTDHLQWFNVENRFEPMGVKMIGVFCTMLRDRDFLDREKYLAGFQIIPDRVPGFGPIDFDSTKISMRVSSYLTEKIREGKSPGLSTFLPDATERIGGFVDACHSLSAATTVKIGQESMLIDEIESILTERMV